MIVFPRKSTIVDWLAIGERGGITLEKSYTLHCIYLMMGKFCIITNDRRPLSIERWLRRGEAVSSHSWKFRPGGTYGDGWDLFVTEATQYCDHGRLQTREARPIPYKRSNVQITWLNLVGFKYVSCILGKIIVPKFEW